MFKVIVAGGRDFTDYHRMKKTLDHLFSNKSEVIIISGMARGADNLGCKYGNEHHHHVIEIHAEWNSDGKRAGFLRNEKMLALADAVVCFWDGKSSGTKHMIDISKAKGIPVRVIKY
jgi:hypothetical protein